METSNRFDLNEALNQWRTSLKDSPAFRPEDMEELETHLRDSVTVLQAKGLSEREAFWVATSRLGTTRALGSEFAKMNLQEIWLNRLLWMVIGIVGIGTLTGLVVTLANLATVALHAMIHKEHLIGPLGLVLSAGSYLGLFLWVWRSGARKDGLLWQAWRLLKAYPILGAIVVFLFSVFNSVGAMGVNVLAARTIQLSAYGVLLQWRMGLMLLPILFWPCVLAWLLMRTTRKPVLR